MVLDELYEIPCPIGCECVDFDSCEGSKFEELFPKSSKKQKFQGQLCGLIPPRVCCCRPSSKLKYFIGKRTVQCGQFTKKNRFLA